MSNNAPLIRVGVRLPSAVYEKLKAFANANNVPMAVVIRLLVADWAASDATARSATLV